MAKMTRAERRRNRALAALSANGNGGHEPVARAVEDVAELSKQPRFTSATTFLSTIYRWVKTADLEEPIYMSDSRVRDKWLRAFVRREPHLAGVLNSVVQVDKNRGWNLTGGRNQVARFTRILHDAYVVTPDTFGWRPGIASAAQSFYSSDIGAVVEVGRDGDGGPLRGLFHVDSARCKLTGQPENPLNYYPLNGGIQEWAAGDYFRVASMQSTDEQLSGLGFCAVSRCLELAKIMVAVYEHDKEQLLAKAPRGLLLLKGVSEQMWNDAMTAREEAMSSMERSMYGGVAVLASDAPGDIEATLIALSQLPKDFDSETFTSLLMYGYSLAFGYDPREFWPVSGGQLGTATETETQHRKATGKGGLDFALAYQENLQRLLPDSLAFEFEERDSAGEMADAELARSQAAIAVDLYQAAPQGGQSLLSREQALFLLAERGLIPQEWTQAEEEVTLDDTEAPEEASQTEPDMDGNTEPAPVDELSRARALAWDKPSVRRAIELYPNDPIVTYRWPENRQAVLWESGWEAQGFRKLWPVAREVGRTANPKESTDEVERSVPLTWVERSVSETLSLYRATITDFVDRADGARDVRRITTGMIQTIRGMATQAYVEGMREGGISDAENMLEAADEAAIKAWIASQTPHVNDFIKAARDEGHSMAILNRIELWVASLESLAGLGRLSAEKNQAVTWQYGDTKEKCSTCLWLHGQRHRAKWFTDKGYIPRQPGSDKLECGGWNCRCGLYDSQGERVL